jgi:hypothetical protein
LASLRAEYLEAQGVLKLAKFPLSVLTAACCFCAGALSAEPKLETSAFADTYYAHDFNDLPSKERPYTTQAYYNEEYTLNLGHISTRLTGDRWRGRLAAQYGTSVIANYKAEPDEFWRYVQEGFVGYHLSPRLWIDAGIYFSHIGSESWISSLDINYTRSLIADNSPYYQSGVRATYEVSDTLVTQVHLLRGWQNISADESLSLGTQLKWGSEKGWCFTHNTFLGDIHGTRFFNDFILLFASESGWKSSLTFDVGVQDQRAQGDIAWWHGWSWLVQQPLSNDVRLGTRVERYADPHKVIIEAVNGKSVNFTGLSMNVDVDLTDWLLWRTEYRVLFDTQGVFPNAGGFRDYDQLLVGSLTVQLDKWS